jgi:hypothetical protein
LWNSKLRFERPTSNFGFFTKRSLTTQFAPQSSEAEQRDPKQSNCRAAIRDTLDTLYMGSGLDGASALTGWTRENAPTAAKMSKSLDEDFTPQ